MMIQPLNLELLNLRSQQSYPFTSASSGLDVTGAIELPNDVVLSVALPVDMSLNAESENFHLLACTAFGDGALFEFGYNGDLVGSVMVSSVNHVFGKSYILVGQGDFQSSTGLIQVGRLESLPLGRYEFNVSGARLEPDCIRPQLPRVLSVTVDNNGELSPELTGNIVIASGENTGVSYSDNDPYTTIRIDVVPGATSVVEDCPCTDDVVSSGTPIVSINGIYSQSGNLQLASTNCTEIEASGGSLIVNDTCSTPCCGSPELEAVTSELSTLSKAVQSLHPTVSDLQAKVTILNERKSPRYITLVEP